MSTADPALTEPTSSPRLSPWMRLVRVFTDPVHAWDGLKDKSSWLLPLLLTVGVSVALLAGTYHSVMLPMSLDQLGEAVASGRMEPAQEAAARQYYESPVGFWVTICTQAIAVTLITFLQALVLWFGIGFVLGTKMRYGSAMDVVCWSGLVKIPHALLLFALAFQRQSFMGVHLGLGVLVPEGDAPSKIRAGLQGVLDLIGPFEAWWMFVVVLGAAALSGAPRKNVAWVAVALYLALGAFFASLGAYFGPGA